MTLLALIQALLPLLMAAWLLGGRTRTRFDLLLRLVAAWLILLGVWQAGIWLALPLATVALLAVLVLFGTYAAAVRMSLRTPATGSARIALWSGRAAAVAASALGLWALVPAIAGSVAPEAPVELAFPFRSGTWIVANGGAAERINGHFMTLRPNYARWRGESYGVDLVRVGRLGFRTRNPVPLRSPPDPSAYLSWGEPVHAPCSGIVEAVEARRPDMPVPQRDRQHLEGNFVRLRCGAHVVFLGHFRRDGVEVRAGAMVATGDRLGVVGNSGNTDEPHLHVHVQRPGPPQAPLAGEPLFLSFRGRFPVRNMLLRGAPVP